MEKLTAGNISHFLYNLDKNVTYHYIHKATKGLIKIVHVDMPEGGLKIKRWEPNKGESSDKAKIISISNELLWRFASAFIVGKPVNIDKVLGSSYNTRSVVESLLAHTPQFYYCYPKRIDNIGGVSTTKKGHKHLLWLPDEPHRNGIIVEKQTDIEISEIPLEVRYESLELSISKQNNKLDIDILRRHTQIQIALYFIGKELDFRTWIAQNDKGILYHNKRLSEYDGVISSLRDVSLIKSFEDVVQAALMIDCIWFKNGKLMPAVMEVEHSTGVTSGLSRMKNFQDKFPGQKTRYVIVAPDEDREKVIREGNKEQFKSLEVRFFPYSAVEEFYSLCQRRKLKGVTEEFLDCFMEPVLIYNN